MGKDFSGKTFDPPEGKSAKDIVALASAGDDKVIVWYQDSTFSRGSHEDLDGEQSPASYSLAEGKTPGDIVGMAIGTDSKIYTWYNDNTFSVGTQSDLDAYDPPEKFTLPKGMTPAAVVEMAIASNGHVYAWYSDGRVSSGTVSDLEVHSAPDRYDLPSKEGYDFQALPDLDISGGLATSPSGTVFFGRRSGAVNIGSGNWQVYGLLDDVAIFKRALTAQEISSLYSKKRLILQEPPIGGPLGGGVVEDVYVAWSFDQPGPFDRPVPKKLDGWHESSAQAMRVVVSRDRNSGLDSAWFQAPSLVGNTEAPLTLPFKANETWRVSQGMDVNGGSHNSSASFSYDFVLANEQKNCGSAGASVLNAGRGKAAMYRHDQIPPGSEEVESFIRVQIAEKEYVTYLHVARQSFNQKIWGGESEDGVDYVIPEEDRPVLAQEEFLSTVGKQSCHLHFAGRYHLKWGNTIPFAFSNYWASDDEGKTYGPVVRGHPCAFRRKRPPIPTESGHLFRSKTATLAEGRI